MEDSLFCGYCGKSVTEEPEETIVFNAPFVSDPDFVWDVRDFTRQKEVEEIEFSWSENRPERTASALESAEAAWLWEGDAPAEAKEPKQAETREPAEPPDRETERKKAPSGETENRERKEVPPAPEQAEKIDKFYTFNKKNEEFQKLLDREYEKIKKGRDPGEDSRETPIAPEEEPPPAKAPETEKREKEPPSPKPPEKRKEEPEEESDAENIIFDNETLVKKFDTTEFKKDLLESALEKAGAKGAVLEEEQLDNWRVSGLPEPPGAPLEEAEKYASDFKPEFLAENTESTEIEEIEKNAENAETTRSAAKDNSLQEQERSALEGFLRDTAKQEAFRALEALWGARDSAEPEPARAGGGAAEGKEQEPGAREETETVAEAKEEARAPGERKKTEKQAAERKEQEPGARKKTEKNAPGKQKKEVDKGKTPDRRQAGKIILIIIIAIVAAEIAILSIRALAPNSLAAWFINEKLSFTFSWLDGGDEQDEEITDPENGGDPPGGSDDPAPSAAPRADKAELVASQLAGNKNILRIEANDALAYSPEKTYEARDIHDSKPIENNIWIHTDEQIVYYDESLVAALIQFDSQWIDYVNEGDQSVLSMTKAGSAAERNILSFSKVNAMTKTFKLLQIGEIREGENGFYVWAYEEIDDNEGGKTTERQYNWIYHMEPVADQMKIVGYYPF